MKLVPVALVCLLISSIWYVLHDIDYVAESLTEISLISALYESSTYALISLAISILHYLSLIWIAYAFWWRLKSDVSFSGISRTDAR